MAAQDLEKTKVTFYPDELDFVIHCIEGHMAELYDGYGVDDKGMYEEYKENQQLLNRLKRAYIRMGGEIDIEPVMNITTWAKLNSGERVFGHVDEDV